MIAWILRFGTGNIDIADQSMDRHDAIDTWNFILELC